MTKTQFCFIALLFIATQAGVTFAMQRIVPHAMPTQWEYQIYPLEPHQSGAYYGSDLDGIGEKGWELVAVIPRGNQQVCVFKKPVFVPLKAGNEDEKTDTESKTNEKAKR